MNLDNKVALITGASEGIGRACAWAFARAGCRLILVARNSERLGALQQELAAEGYYSIIMPADLTVREQIQQVFTRIRQQYDGIDILINNAGLGLYAPLERLEAEDVHYLFELNVFAPITMIQLATPLLEKQGGTIVNISSILGRRAIPLSGAYCASKAALEMLSDAARMELHQKNIRVTTVYPGVTETAFIANAMGENHQVGANRFPRTRPEKVAAKIVQAVRRGQRDVFITPLDYLIILGTRLFPGLADWAMTKLLLPRYEV
jgi:short-subunit dehydrogenase